MKAAGVEVRKFHPPHWYTSTASTTAPIASCWSSTAAIGFTGGVGIADQWTGNAQDPEHWRDTHFQVEGPVVAQMQAVFMDNWIKATGEVLHGERVLSRR